MPTASLRMDGAPVRSSAQGPLYGSNSDRGKHRASLEEVEGPAPWRRWASHAISQRRQTSFPRLAGGGGGGGPRPRPRRPPLPLDPLRGWWQGFATGEYAGNLSVAPTCGSAGHRE